MEKYRQSRTPKSEQSELVNGSSLRQLRKELGKTQKWFAEKSGYTQTHISNIERGNQLINEKTLEHLTNILLGKTDEMIEKDSMLMVKELTKKALKNPNIVQKHNLYKAWYETDVFYLAHNNYTLLEYNVKRKNVMSIRKAHTQIHANAINKSLDELNHPEHERAEFKNYQVSIENSYLTEYNKTK